MPDDVHCGNCGFAVQKERKPRLCDQTSPYQFLIGSKIRLPDAESGRAGIKNRIDILQKELKESQSRFQRLRRAVLGAEADCAALLTTINCHISINPPVHDLPFELLEHILLLSYDAPFDLMDTAAGRPWVLARACRRWKRTVLESATTWSSFRTLDRIYRNFKTDVQARQYVEDALIRSQQMPLTIELDTQCHFIPFDAISARASRLQKLTIYTTSGCLSKLKWSPGELISLTSLRLLIFHVQDGFPFDISDAPELNHLTLSSCRGDMPSSIRSPYPQLTSLDIRLESTNSNFMSTRFILSQCANLVQFVDRTLTSDHSTSTSTQHLILHGLREITVLSPWSLFGLSCPDLEVFGAMDIKVLEFEGNIGNMFTQFLQPVDHPLRELRLGCNPSYSYTRRSTDITLYNDFASLSASVIHLDMDLRGGGHDKWNWFTNILTYESHRRDKAIVAPHLQSLKLDIVWYYKSTLNKSYLDFIDGIVSRWEIPAGHTTVSKLRSVEVFLSFRFGGDGKDRYGYDLPVLPSEDYWRDFKQNWMYLELRKMEDEGLELTIHGDARKRSQFEE